MVVSPGFLFWPVFKERIFESVNRWFQPKPEKKNVPDENVLSEEKTLTEVRPEGQVIVHCHFLSFPGALIRIWKSTFLIPQGETTIRSALVHAENISFAPVWTELDGYGIFTFTLLFEALPQSCQRFDLKEEIEQTGAFFIPDISRNNSDVYHVWL